MKVSLGKVKPHQLDLMTTVSTPTVDPSGSVAVVATSRANYDTDSYTGQLWQIALDGSSAPRRITRGKSDSEPQFSPDGETIAFLRPDAKGRPQLALMDARGGEPLVITNRTFGVSSFVWSADSGSIAFTSTVAEPGRYGTVDGVGAGAEDPRRVTENKVRGNGAGWTQDRRSALFLVDVPDLGAEPYAEPTGRAALAAANAKDTEAAADKASESAEGAALPVVAQSAEFPEAKLLSDPQFSVSGIAFSPDGSRIFFASAQHAGADDDLVSGIYSVAIADGVAVENGKELESDLLAARLEVSGSSPMSLHTPTFSGNGKTLFLLGQELGESGVDFVARNTGVFAVSTADLPSTAPRSLTDLETNDYGDVHSTLVPSPDGEGVYALARHRGAGELHHVNASGELTLVSQGERVILGVAAAGESIVVNYTDPRTPGEVALVGAAGELTALTDFAAPLREATTVAEQVEFTATSPDGYPVHGWLYAPEGEGPHPVLLNIHGGPFADYHWAYFDEAQVYARAGYAVLQCNPRGSAGYGREHGVSIKEAMGTVDMADVLAFYEQAVAAHDNLDSERAGVLGGSYGGYLTSWIIGHDHRFAGAIVERGFLDPFSFVGTSDIGWFFADGYTGTDPVQILAQSPMAVAHQVQTPTLVLHSEEDLRCPFEQAQRYFQTLKRAGKEVEMLAFPGENHELSRSGTPWHRTQRFDAILEWWDRYLPAS